jgi:hypothetical protein
MTAGGMAERAQVAVTRAGRIVVVVLRDVAECGLVAGDRLVIEQGRVRLVRELPGFDGVLARLSADELIDPQPDGETVTAEAPRHQLKLV